MNIADLSPVLQQDHHGICHHGIWIASNASEISYPAEGNSRCFQVENRSYWFEHRNNVISDLVGKHASSVGKSEIDFIDIGGGNGFVSARLTDDGHNVVLLEPGPDGALNAKTRRNVPHVICSTLQNAGIKANSFDAAGAFDVIEHIQDDSAFVAEIAKVVRPGGFFIAMVPAHVWLWSNEDVRAGHYRRYTTVSFEDLLRPFFNPIFVSYFFQPLVLPIWLLRVLPSRLRLGKGGSTVSDSSEHGANSGFITNMIRRILANERKNLLEGRRAFTGSSVLFVGRKLPEKISPK